MFQKCSEQSLDSLELKILSMYRLTFGQARQEELLEYLFKNYDEPEKLRKLFIYKVHCIH